jgi:hypothetical protein
MRISFFILILLPLLSQGQGIGVTISDNDILIGDQIKLSININSGNGRVQSIDLKPIEEDGIFEIVDPGQLTKSETNNQLLQEVTFTSFDSGTHYLPAIYAVIENSFGHKDTFRSNAIPINVNTVPPDSLGLSPVKPIIEEEKVWMDYLAWILPFALLLVFIFALWFWNKYKTSTKEEVAVIPEIPAHEQALNALNELKDQQVWQRGDIKEYEVRISEILRRYIERKFNFPALEWTTREIMAYFQNEKWSHLPLSMLNETLLQSDMVKFAKSKPGDQAHERQLDHARQFVLITREMSTEEE